VSGGTVVEGVVDAYPAPATPEVIALNIGRLRALVGAEIDLVEIVSILTRLGCKLACHDEVGRKIMAANEQIGAQAGPSGEGCHATQGLGCALANGQIDESDLTLPILPPSFRPDLTRDVDLIEEVLRVWGMERVQSTLPGGRERIGTRTLTEQLAATIGATLRASGLNETMTYAFAPLADSEQLKMQYGASEQAVELVNPMNAEQSVLRRTIIAGLLRSVAYNLNHGVPNVHLYEAGRIFFTAEGRKTPKERQRVAGVLCGKWQEQGWNNTPANLDFYDAKGVLDNLLRELCTPKVRYKAAEAHATPWLTPGRAATIASGSRELGWVGEMHPQVLAAFEISQPVVAFELDLEALIATAASARPYVDVPQYPAVELDVAIVVDEQLSAERLVQIATSAGGALLEQAHIFDVYRDETKVGAGKKSVALKLVYRATERTLTSEEIDKLHTKVLKKLTGATGGEVRA
jgi:phenylalanyl-tRNA synthetase beta chain